MMNETDKEPCLNYKAECGDCDKYNLDCRNYLTRGEVEQSRVRGMEYSKKYRMFGNRDRKLEGKA